MRLRRRALLLAAAPFWAAADATAQGPPRVVARRLDFPRDHGAHTEFSLEWWYATGALQTERGAETLGFQLTFFRSRTDLAQDLQSRFAPRQLLFAHMALSDPAQRRLRYAQRIVRWSGDAQAPLGAAGTEDTGVHIGNWQLRRSGPIGPGTVYRAAVSDPDAGFGYELDLSVTQPILLHGDAGVGRRGPEPDQASYYYTQPQLTVSGTLVRGLDGAPSGTARRDSVRGLAWLDHEWSEGRMHPEAVGWDWIGINLTDGPGRGGALMAIRYRRADGSAVWASATLRSASGALQSFGPEQVRFVSGRTWLSPATQARYPVQWQVELPVGRYRVEPLFDAQEVDSRASTGTIYWEGLSELRDDDGHVIGRGYLELTGYAGKLQLR
jgi:predicted secreted hydrolase